MIGSFWNLCRACPSMPVDKLHSEYRSTYRWHEYTGGPEVVRKPPVPNQFAINEPPLPRRKKCPELAYRTHEIMSNGPVDRTDSSAVSNRARSEERTGTPSRRSKSEGRDLGKRHFMNIENGVANGGVRTGTGLMNGQDFGGKSSEQAANAQELEPLVNDIDEKPQRDKMEAVKNMKNDKARFGFAPESTFKDDSQMSASLTKDPNWMNDVLELRKKAGEYRNRGWGVEMNPELFNKQQEIWEQVSRRSSLSALSLASTVRPISKEEKEKENNKKSSPSKPQTRGRIPGSAKPVENSRNLPDGLVFSRKRDMVRHHLERTTGPDMEEGALLPSPTREKLMPAIPRSKGDSPQRGSPQKTALSRHGSPQKGSPQKSSPKKMTNKGGYSRSQSVGPVIPATTGESGSSPKRQVRSGSTVTASTASSAAKSHNKKTPTSASAPAHPERRPRPTTLSTTNHTRSKSSTLPHSGRAQSALYNNLLTNSHNTNQSSSSQSQINNLNNSNNLRNKNQLNKAIKLQSRAESAPSTLKKTQQRYNKTGSDKKTVENEDETDKETVAVSVTASPQLQPEITEQIIKSPPEPTRVKSPEQILMRSPDPVNWTVPLDTGKTFTVTQNVREGDPMMRPHSEIKASTPFSENPPPAPQSAPPELSEETKILEPKEDVQSVKEPEPETSAGTGSHRAGTELSVLPDSQPVPGSTLRCLDDPTFDINSPSSVNRNLTTEVLDKARDRFDRFWGSQSEKQGEDN